jgi:hypothetical protein
MHTQKPGVYTTHLFTTSSLNSDIYPQQALSMAATSSYSDSIPTSTITSVIPEEDDLINTVTSSALDHGLSDELPLPTITSHW